MARLRRARRAVAAAPAAARTVVRSGGRRVKQLVGQAYRSNLTTDIIETTSAIAGGVGSALVDGAVASSSNKVDDRLVPAAKLLITVFGRTAIRRMPEGVRRIGTAFLDGMTGANSATFVSGQGAKRLAAAETGAKK